MPHATYTSSFTVTIFSPVSTSSDSHINDYIRIAFYLLLNYCGPVQYTARTTDIPQILFTQKEMLCLSCIAPMTIHTAMLFLKYNKCHLMSGLVLHCRMFMTYEKEHKDNFNKLS